MNKSNGTVADAIKYFLSDTPYYRSLGAVRLYVHCRNGAIQEIESQSGLVEKAVQLIWSEDRQEVMDGAVFLCGIANYGTATNGLGDKKDFLLRVAELSTQLPRQVAVEKLLATLAKQNPERRCDTLVPYFLRKQFELRL